jgi:hypothetical protein
MVGHRPGRTRRVLWLLPMAVLSAAGVSVLLVTASRPGSALVKVTPHVEAPLARMGVTQYAGKTSEVFATLAPEVRLGDVIDLSLFDDIDPGMTLDSAKERFGPPTGEWSDPFCRALIAFYQRPQGRVSFCRYSTSGGYRWDTVGYPLECSHARIFRDQRLVQQIVPWLSQGASVSVHVTQVGRGEVTVEMNKGGCSWLVFS